MLRRPRSRPSGSGRHIRGEARQYSPYVAPPRNPTVRPSSACASGDVTRRDHDAGALVADGMASPTLAARERMTGSAIGAVTVGSSADPPATAWETSAIASNSPRSEGLTGAASTRTNTSRGPGRGVSTVPDRQPQLALRCDQAPELAHGGGISRMAVPFARGGFVGSLFRHSCVPPETGDHPLVTNHRPNTRSPHTGDDGMPVRATHFQSSFTKRGRLVQQTGDRLLPFCSGVPGADLLTDPRGDLRATREAQFDQDVLHVCFDGPG